MKVYPASMSSLPTGDMEATLSSSPLTLLRLMGEVAVTAATPEVKLITRHGGLELRLEPNKSQFVQIRAYIQSSVLARRFKILHDTFRLLCADSYLLFLQ